MSPLRSIVAALCFVLLCLGASAGHADDPPNDRAALLERCGRLPVWYNGRVGTLDSVSRAVIRDLSGESATLGADGKPLQSAAWCLNIAAGNPEWLSEPVIRVEHPDIAAALGLDPTRNAGDAVQFCSVQQVLEHLSELGEMQAKHAAEPGPPTEAALALQSLALRVGAVRRIAFVFRAPNLDDPMGVQLALADARDAETSVIPLLVPPREQGGNWWNVPFATAVAKFGSDAGIPTNPAAPHVLALIEAWGEQNIAKARQALDGYEHYLRETNLAESPYHFEPPPGWHELGIPPRGVQLFFGDVIAPGWTTTMLEWGQDDSRATINVSLFEAETAPRERIINDWRMAEGLAPG